MALDTSNRYFESKKNQPQEQVEYEQGVDPKRILAAACLKRNLIHMEDNKVMFNTSKIDKNRERKDLTLSSFPSEPQIFWVGDIVEVQFSIMAVSMKKTQRKLKLKLRTVAMIDKSFTKAEENVKSMVMKGQRMNLKCKEGETKRHSHPGKLKLQRPNPSLILGQPQHPYSFRVVVQAPDYLHGQASWQVWRVNADIEREMALKWRIRCSADVSGSSLAKTAAEMVGQFVTTVTVAQRDVHLEEYPIVPLLTPRRNANVSVTVLSLMEPAQRPSGDSTW
ncbi:hypothetical protein ARMGADRAFT_1066571 [Armillaria gallica]|uniref:Uncharacterized protein n=1 Tax=Armillaria gallica TaxID=47427 RepID=A0A2H3CTN3_ARMGA|nr:hypothetical protein ARMGADRAFT_1066571 [Armillaria gallica]